MLAKLFTLYIFSIIFAVPLKATNYEPNTFDKAQLLIAHSCFLKPIKKVMHLFTPLLNAVWGTDNTLAPEYYQKIAAEAQQYIGIDPADRVLVKTANGISPTGKKFHGIATITGIYINQKALQDKSYGFTRHVLHHEAIHYKYDDSLMGSLLAAASCLVTDITSSKIARRSTYLYNKSKVIGFVCGLSVGISVLKKYHYYAEHRADMQGAYATQCHQCLNELLLNYKHMSEYGYATKQEIQEIQKKFMEKNMLCAHHSDRIS